MFFGGGWGRYIAEQELHLYSGSRLDYFKNSCTHWLFQLVLFWGPFLFIVSGTVIHGTIHTVSCSIEFHSENYSTNKISLYQSGFPSCHFPSNYVTPSLAPTRSCNPLLTNTGRWQATIFNRRGLLHLDHGAKCKLTKVSLPILNNLKLFQQAQWCCSLD